MSMAQGPMLVAMNPSEPSFPRLGQQDTTLQRQRGKRTLRKGAFEDGVKQDKSEIVSGAG